jgi:hypothetical protein
MSYSAIICKIKVSPIPNAEKIQVANCAGYTAIVGIDHKDGELGIFFPHDGQLSWPMVRENKLHRENGGYLEDNRRVRTIKLMGIKSEGIWLSLNSLSWIETYKETSKKKLSKRLNKEVINLNKKVSDLKEGDKLTSLNGVLLCNKYITRGTQEKSARKVSIWTRAKNSIYSFFTPKLEFPKHFDTEKLQHALSSQKIPYGMQYFITRKLHGTSQRSGFVKSNSLVSKISSKLGFSQKYISVYGSRNLTLPHKSCKDLYRVTAHKLFEGKLNKDEIVYYEIVGFGENDSSIMQSHTISDAKISKKFANPMYYSYGMKKCSDENPKYQENFDVYVYRITQNGKNLSPTELQVRVKQLGMKIVPHVWTGIWDPENIEAFLKDCKKITEENGCRSEIDDSHIEEGICIRFYGNKNEPLDGAGEIFDLTVKYKSWLFCDCEGIAKNSDTYIDAEEIEGDE